MTRKRLAEKGLVEKFDPNDELARSAVFSKCGKYRYSLLRSWGSNSRRCVFIMLNPSTADECTNDRSVSKCEKYARMWGHDSLTVVNLFAWRDTHPDKMKAVPDPIGPENDSQILDACKGASRVVCAWSNHGSHMNRAFFVTELLWSLGVKLYVLKVNKTGEPAHPLYLPYSLKPEPFVL